MSATQFDPRITAYFGDAVLRTGFMPLPHLFLRHYRQLGLSHLQAMFVMQLMEIAWDLGDPPTTVTKLSERLGVDRRTVQLCGRDVHRLGLVEIYDQWDEGGAQIENGYDLSPLFRRLAEYAPEPRLDGQIRSRRSRYDEEDGGEESTTPPVNGGSPPPAIQGSPPRVNGGSPPPLNAGSPPPRSPVRRAGDRQIAAPAIQGSQLKEEVKKTLKKQQEQPKKHHQQALLLFDENENGGGGSSDQHSVVVVNATTEMVQTPIVATAATAETVLPLADIPATPAATKRRANGHKTRPATVADTEPAAKTRPAVASDVEPAAKPAAPSGRSLRWDVPLTSGEVATSRRVLDRIGLNATVAAAAASTLHPAEGWALWTYARAAHLAAGWIAKQVYHFGGKRPQAAPLSSRYDAAGRLLAQLDPAAAELLIDAVDEHCPDAAYAVLSDPRVVATTDGDAAVRAIWAVMAEMRGGTPRLPVERAIDPPPADSTSGTALASAEAWDAALAQVQTVVSPASFATWLQDTHLLDINGDVALVGTSNVFVRDAVASGYEEELASAISTVMGRTLRVEVVIGEPTPS